MEVFSQQSAVDSQQSAVIRYELAVYSIRKGNEWSIWFFGFT